MLKSAMQTKVHHNHNCDEFVKWLEIKPESGPKVNDPVVTVRKRVTLDGATGILFIVELSMRAQLSSKPNFSICVFSKLI